MKPTSLPLPAEPARPEAAPPSGRPPTLAVIIVNYNYAQYVGECIESALNQTSPFDEVIVVNDGSTDLSLQVIARYAGRLLAIDKPNGGQLTATLAGLARSQADYVSILDADDLLEPGFAEAVRARLAGRPVKLQCRLTGIDGAGAPLMSVFPSYPAGYDSAAMREDNRTIGFYVCPPTAGNIYLRRYLDGIDLTRLEPNEPLDGPPALAAPYFGEVVTLDRPLARYRVHGANQSLWDRPDAALLRGEVDWFYRRWRQVDAMRGAEQPPFGAAMPLYVGERELMIAAIGDGRGMMSRVAGFVPDLWATNITPRQKLLLTAWALALLAPSARARTYLVRARRSPLNRPRLLKRLLGRLLGSRNA